MRRVILSAGLLLTTPLLMAGADDIPPIPDTPASTQRQPAREEPQPIPSEDAAPPEGNVSEVLIVGPDGTFTRTKLPTGDVKNDDFKRILEAAAKSKIRKLSVKNGVIEIELANGEKRILVTGQQAGGKPAEEPPVVVKGTPRPPTGQIADVKTPRSRPRGEEPVAQGEDSRGEMVRLFEDPEFLKKHGISPEAATRIREEMSEPRRKPAVPTESAEPAVARPTTNELILFKLDAILQRLDRLEKELDSLKKKPTEHPLSDK